MLRPDSSDLSKPWKQLKHCEMKNTTRWPRTVEQLKSDKNGSTLLSWKSSKSDTYELVKQEWKLVTMGNLSQLFKDTGLPSNSKWANTFPKILQFLILNIEFFFYVLWWQKFWDLIGIKQNNWILCLFTFYMVHQHSQNCVYVKAC